MKKILSVLITLVVTTSFITGHMTKISASYIYKDSPVEDLNYYCIVQMDDPPLADYEYAQQNGVNEFLATEEGKIYYTNLRLEHVEMLNKINEYIGTSGIIVYDYTALYNGFSVVMKESEYKNIYLNKQDLGIKNIYLTELCSDDEVPSTVYPMENIPNAINDISEHLFKATGISNVDNKGDSTVLAIIDNEFYLDHEYLKTMPQDVTGRLSSEYIDSISPYLSSTSGEERYEGGGYYLNEKIPYRFNYATHTKDTEFDYTKYPTHGTHVAGIAAGNSDAVTSKAYSPQGVAPNAQLVLMSSDLNYYSIMAAYDDCALIGVDSVNASYGCSYVSVKSAPYEVEAINNMDKLGIMFCTSAGNEGKLEYSGVDSLLNTDYATGGAPNGNSSAFSVGSVGNPVITSDFITVENVNYMIYEPSPQKMFPAFGNMYSDGLDYKIIPGYGAKEDFENIDVDGKIAVIKRGELLFSEKAQNAIDKGAIGVIFYNNVLGELPSYICQNAFTGMVSYEDGQALIAAKSKHVYFNTGKMILASPTTKMSDFSSWGYTEELALKPDISAFGGNIVSSLPYNQYGSASGTSMASPQITGITALLKEYLIANKEKYGIQNNSDYTDIIPNLLMSTAVPIYSSNGIEIASPRVQGSGLVNIEKAMNTPAYLYTESEKDNYRPKLSLGDNLESKFGTIDFSISTFNFHIKNISDAPQTYTLSADIFVDNFSEDDDQLAWNTKRADATMKFKSGLSEISEITVGAGEDVVINLDMNLTAEQRQYIKETFKNGTFVEGYVHLESESAPNLVLPFMGYYGEWSSSEIFEPFIYNTSMNASYSSSLLLDFNMNYSGINMVAMNSDEIIFGTPYYSPNGDNVLDNICAYLGFKRRCYNVNADIYKSNYRSSTKVYSEKFSLPTGSWSVDQDSEPINQAFQINWDMSGAMDGDIYELRITAEDPFYSDGGKKQILTQEFKIDLTPPEVKNTRRFVVNGEEYIQLEVYDNNAVQGAVLLNESGEEIEALDVDYCETADTNTDIFNLKMPDDYTGCYAEVYDMAGNSIKVDISKTSDAYFLTFNEDLFFASNDKSFNSGIRLTDVYGKDIDYNISTTPQKAYSEGITEISIMLGKIEILTIPVTIGLAGDVDTDGKVSLYDVIAICKYLVYPNNSDKSKKLIEKIGIYGMDLADYDRNGKIDLYDAIEIAKSLVKGR